MRGIEGEADTLAAVSAGTSGLLIVALEALGYVVVDDIAHVGLVDTHAEGDSGHDDGEPLHEEVVLCLTARHGVHAGMVGTGVDVVGTQHLGQLLHLTATQTVDDATLALVLLDEADDVLIHLLGLGAHLIIEVRAVERTLELGSIGHAQVLLDVRAHLVGGRSRKGNDGRIAYLIDDWADATILGAEVMAPLRDTVSLIHRVEGDLHIGQKVHVLGLRQRLGRHVEQFRTPRLYVALDALYLGFREGGVDEMGQSVRLAHQADGIHLILHQSNKR